MKRYFVFIHAAQFVTLGFSQDSLQLVKKKYGVEGLFNIFNGLMRAAENNTT